MTVKLQKRGKQEQLKCSKKQMEARSRWKKRREMHHKGGGEDSTCTVKPNSVPPDNKGSKGTIKAHQLI